MIDTHATLESILNAKEKRAQRQKELLAHFGEVSLICLSLTIPGSLKLSHSAVVIFDIALREIRLLLERETLTLLAFESTLAISGAEAIFTCKAHSEGLKRLTCKIEEEHPLGRFMDIDVLDAQGKILSREAFGYPKRRCLICDNEAKICARAHVHSYEELHRHIDASVQKHAWKQSIALWCKRAMKTEVELTPKPGLVDQANSGAHRDMDISTFYSSIEAIVPWTQRFLEEAYMYANEEPQAAFSRLRRIGIACENAMFEATRGVNTHKGMIFCLALLCGAIGRLKARNESLTCQALQTEVHVLCAHVVEEDLMRQTPNSAGMRFFKETGSLGIRGVAQSGFALVFETSLPFFRACYDRFGEENALKQTLLLLMSTVDDSTLWSRGGLEGLAFTKNEAQKILHVGLNHQDWDDALKRFDQTMIAKNLSPGGSADLLALTWLLSRIVES